MQISGEETTTAFIVLAESKILVIEAELQELLGVPSYQIPLTEFGDVADGYETEFSWQSPQIEEADGNKRCVLSVDRSTQAFYLTIRSDAWVYHLSQQGYEELTHKIRTELIKM